MTQPPDPQPDPTRPTPPDQPVQPPTEPTGPAPIPTEPSVEPTGPVDPAPPTPSGPPAEPVATGLTPTGPVDPLGAQPAYGQQPPQPANDPGKILGIVGLILAFFCAVVGLVISIIAFVKSRGAGVTNIPAIIGMIIGVLVTIGWIIGGVAIGNVAAKCAELGPGVHQQGGTTYTCG
ncbi:DUF4190 domain-containing protein [Microlunatus speluncae]|uniref:DUF4190 domain-containing protein n=1 Tax=Microlunatus speluncae TaxID=2594267 RepID=UPI001375C7AF|nr:DUF4190 domain-containing protein [Microlunatus speluncae]